MQSILSIITRVYPTVQLGFEGVKDRSDVPDHMCVGCCHPFVCAILQGKMTAHCGAMAPPDQMNVLNQKIHRSSCQPSPIRASLAFAISPGGRMVAERPQSSKAKPFLSNSPVHQ